MLPTWALLTHAQTSRRIKTHRHDRQSSQALLAATVLAASKPPSHPAQAAGKRTVVRQALGGQARHRNTRSILEVTEQASGQLM